MAPPFNIIKEDKPWYAEGLRFKCTECGRCCSGSPGYTWVTEQEVGEIARFLNLSVQEFCQRYVRQVEDRLALLEYAQIGNSQNFDCVFLKDKKCQIYSVRPKQCRTFPWWPQNLNSEEEWREAAKHCEGINPEAPLVPFGTIQTQLDIQMDKGMKER